MNLCANLRPWTGASEGDSIQVERHRVSEHQALRRLHKLIAVAVEKCHLHNPARTRLDFVDIGYVQSCALSVSDPEHRKRRRVGLRIERRDAISDGDCRNYHQSCNEQSYCG